MNNLTRKKAEVLAAVGNLLRGGTRAAAEHEVSREIGEPITPAFWFGGSRHMVEQLRADREQIVYRWLTVPAPVRPSWRD